MFIQCRLAPLDKRGYCTRDSVVSYNLASVSYRPTLPPITHPSTAPYARLNAHFVRHYKEGTLSRFIVKALLYPEIRRKVDVSRVRLRRDEKTTIRMMRKTKNKKNEDDGEFDSEGSSNEGSGDEEFCSNTSHGSTASNPFGIIHYFTGKSNSEPREGTLYETFIDHEDGKEICPDCTKELFEEFYNRSKNGTLSKNSNFHVQRDSKGSLCFSDLIDLEKIDNQLRDSLPFCSHVVQLLDKEDKKKSNERIHTATAQMRINKFKAQPSEQHSDLSSFDNRTTGAHFACEDLLNLDDSMPMKNTLRQRTLLDERHSMPTLFVGNRFNNCSSTKIYIPTWKDKQDIPTSMSNCAKAGIDIDKHNSSEHQSTDLLSHSSSVDLPGCAFPLPEKISVELMYNFNEATNTKPNSVVIIKPPSMFQNRTPVLSRDVSPFAKHQLNSDKKLSPNLAVTSDKEGGGGSSSNRSSVRRCLSYQFVNLTNPSEASQGPDAANSLLRPIDDHDLDTSTGIIKTQQQPNYPSPRSSDSGMAGSYTLASPDPPKMSDEFFYPYEFDDGEEHQREEDDQQIMRSSKPATGHCTNGRHRCRQKGGVGRELRQEEAEGDSRTIKHSFSSHNLGRFNLVLSGGFDLDDDSDVTDSGQYGDDTSLMKDFNEKYRQFEGNIGNQENGNFEVEENIISTENNRGRDLNKNHQNKLARSRSADQEKHNKKTKSSAIVINLGAPQVNVFHLNGKGDCKERVKMDNKESDDDSLKERNGEPINPDHPTKVYRTGLYAHWWKKEKLPNNILRELYQSSSQNSNKSCKGGLLHPTVNTSSSRMAAALNSVKGSGKNRLIDYLDLLEFLVIVIFH